MIPKIEDKLRGLTEVPGVEYRLTLAKTLQPPPKKNNPDYVKHPFESMTSLHCLVAMVTLNSRWQRKSGTCAQVFFFFSFSHHQSRRLFLASLLFVSTRLRPVVFPISLFSFLTPHSLFPRALWYQVPSQKQEKSTQKQRQKEKELLCRPAQTTQYWRRGCTPAA